MLDRGTGLAKDRLLGLVRQILAANSITRPVSVDDQLAEAGLSSIDMVNLMLAVEAEFDIMIPASDITPENFRSVSTIEALVVSLGSTDSNRTLDGIGTPEPPPAARLVSRSQQPGGVR